MNGLRFGAKVDNYGDAVERFGLSEPAARAEAAGFSSLWLSDHVVMPSNTSSRYPFNESGAISWDAATPWYDPVVGLSVLGSATSTIEIGVGVLIAPLRHPVVLAKQLASIDALFGGRLILGVGAGWLAEEFEALQVPFASRGRRLDEWIHLMRECWTGRPGPFAGEHYSLPEGVLCYPTPAREIPIIIGGMSSAALRRAGLRADGWLALPRPTDDVVEVVAAGISGIQSVSGRAAGGRYILNAAAPEAVAPLLQPLRKLGVTDIVVDVDYADPRGPERAIEILRDAEAQSAE
jgi:probable F420-dependent oxidoreductase